MVLFDKSFLEMLSVDEAAIFDFMFCTNICPIFYVETLADLEKEDPGKRTREKVVADVAAKTPQVHSYPNAMHSELLISEFIGNEIEMRQVPVVLRGRPVRHDGKVGVYFEESPESQAFNRWQRGRFQEVERLFARVWRTRMAATDLNAIANMTKFILARHANPRDEREVYELAKETISGARNRYLVFKTAYRLFGLPREEWKRVINRWKAAGGPPLHDYAPYAAHCLLVELFFQIAITKKIISPDRPSNRTDIVYLYYLPFTMVFVSNDNLHRRTVPLFLNDKQAFVGGDELKRDLKALVEHYSALPSEVLTQGLFAATRSQPPNDDIFLTTRLWKQFGFDIDDTPSIPRKDRALFEKIKAMTDGMEREAKNPTSKVSPAEVTDPDHVTFTRNISRTRGRWKIVPDEAKDT